MKLTRLFTRDLILVSFVSWLAVGLALGFLGFGWSYTQTLDPSVPLASHNTPLALQTSLIPRDQPTTPLQIVGLTFMTVFVAEMGDKTQLATLLMTTQSESPWGIFLGSASGLVAASLISVVVGSGLARWVPESLLQLAAGIGFIMMGLYVLWDELQPPRKLTNVDELETTHE